MIICLGDSFTWGQGLQYYYLIENEGWSWDTCREFLKTDYNFSKLGFRADEYRREKSFPYLIAEELNLPLGLLKLENGGDNFNIKYIVENLHQFVSNTNIDYLVIQFSNPVRRSEDHPSFDSIEDLYYEQIEPINVICQHLNIKWLGISWLDEFGKYLKNNYPKNHVPILYKNKSWDSFDYMKLGDVLKELTIQYTENIDDGHFNLKGHEVIKNSILTKIKSI
jgi:lysophospholipase L1-like esterase